MARHFFRHLVRGVDACHKGGVVHLDIKPDNLIIVDDGTRNGCIKLTDFGLSALWEGPNGARKIFGVVCFFRCFGFFLI